MDVNILETVFTGSSDPERYVNAPDGGFYYVSKGNQLWYSDGTEEGTRFFADGIIGNTGSIYGILPFDSKVFYTAEKNSRTVELWISDGTEEGTIQLTNRELSFSGNRSISHLTRLGDILLFSLYDPTRGTELWKSDGTPEGTELVKDIRPGSNSSEPNSFFVYQDKVVFRAYTDEYGTEWWSTDGTEAGTNLVADIYPGTQSALFISSDAVIYNGEFYFFANDGATGSELWKSDGTEDGTTLVRDIYVQAGQSSSGGSFIGGVVNGKLVFTAFNLDFGTELWVSDGTRDGTQLLLDIAEGSLTGAFNNEVWVSANKIFFSGNDFGEQVGLWVSDGTATGTKFVNPVFAQKGVFDDAGETLYFSDGNANNKALWRSDGTALGTLPISEGVTLKDFSGDGEEMVFAQNKVFFTGTTELNGNEMWVSDGTLEGTRLFLDQEKSNGASPSILTSVGERVFFRGIFGGTGALGVSDGTPEGTYYLDINPNGSSIDDESEFIEFNGKVVVSALDGQHGFEPWISDGTQIGTFMLKDINPGNASSLTNEEFYRTFFVIDDILYFAADDGVTGLELWRSDGTTDGTFRVSNVANGVNNWTDSFPGNVTKYKGEIYFSASDGTGTGLFKTNGQTDQVTKVTNLSRLSSLTVIGDKLVMVAETSGSSYGPHDLWVTDGTEAGTAQIATFGDGIDSGIQFLAELNGQLYFVAKYLFDENDPTKFGKSVFKTDGTVDGTIPLFIGSEHPSITGLDIDILFTCGDFVYFGIRESLGNADLEFWRTDGTVEGTVLAADAESDVTGFFSTMCYDKALFLVDYNVPNALKMSLGDPASLYTVDLNLASSGPLTNGNSIFGGIQAESALFLQASAVGHGTELFILKPGQINGGGVFSDADNDGVIDLFDLCPDTEPGLDVNDQGCADDQLDEDNDGVSDSVDQCPGTAEGSSVNAFGCSMDQNEDEDNDGVLNLEDLCPNTPDGEQVNAEGCSDSQLDDDNDGINNFDDQCPDTPVGEEVNSNGCSATQLDDDGDGVNNFEDQCPNTIPGNDVDEFGCAIFFTLPQDNFSIKTFGETCVGKKNGQISIETQDHRYIYSVEIDGQSYSFVQQLEVPLLEASSYSFCIEIAEEPDFSQCFTVNIPSVDGLSGKFTSFGSKEALVEQVVIENGTAPFHVMINNVVVLTTESSTFFLEVEKGDLVEIITSLPCEGKMEKRIDNGVKARFYPNPATREVFVNFNTSFQEIVQLKIYDVNFKLIREEGKQLNGTELHVELSDLNPGMYFLRIDSSLGVQGFKLIKN